jgi:hypothetical protein
VSIFRAQLLLEEQRRLYDVWLSAADTLNMPTREAFQPRAFGPLLPFISLIEVQNGQISRVRVAGSALRDVFGTCPLSSLKQASGQGAGDTIARIVQDRRPACGVAPKVNDQGGTGVRFWLRLPIGFDNNVEAVIGLDIALCGARAPDWALLKMAAG